MLMSQYWNPLKGICYKFEMDIFKVPFQIKNVPQTTLPLISRSNTIYDFFSVRH